MVMIFDKNNLYLLTNIVRTKQNQVHDEIIGRYCVLDILEAGKFGWFKVEMEDGYHRICTSIVKDVSMSDDTHDVTLTTTNSVYTFILIHEDSPVTLGVESHAER